MGYENLMLVGRLHVDSSVKESWFDVMCTVDFCKESALRKAIERVEPKWKHGKALMPYFFAPGGDGNETITKDMYGQNFHVYSVVDVLTALRLVMSRDREKYRRYVWAEALLSSMAEDPSNLDVIFFGH